MSKDYYAVLGVDRSASEAEIKKAYRRLSKEWHPDKKKGDTSAEQKFKEINEAYEVLGNGKKRKQYDQFGNVSDGAGGSGFGGFDFSNFQQGDLGGFGDIFESFFGGAGGGRSRSRVERGNDMQVRMTVAFADVVTGVRKTIAIERLAACEACGGSGSEGGALIPCSACGATGQVTRRAQSIFGTIQQSMVCSTCSGSGTVPEHMCKQCSGEGRRREKSNITIDVPAGIDDGQTLRVTGKGEAGHRKAPAGDLFVVIAVIPHPHFSREGADIHSRVSIPVLSAILGAEVLVETAQGMVTLAIPAGTQTSQIMRIKGKGLPVLNTSRFGDHYVEITVKIPTKLSRAERTLLEEWKHIQ